MPPSRSPSRKPGEPEAPAANADTATRSDRARADAVFARLQDAVTALVLAAEASLGDRCPYRDAEDRCTFSGGCQNQQRDHASPSDVRCGGDHLLKWTP